MAFVQKSTFFSYVFLKKKSQKETFFDILDRKQCFLDLKSEVLPWFLSIIDLFLICFFKQKKPERNILWYSGWKIMLFGPQKWSSHKLEKSRHFGKGLVHGLSQKIDLFLIGFFWSKKARKKDFLIFWIETNAF